MTLTGDEHRRPSRRISHFGKSYRAGIGCRNEEAAANDAEIPAHPEIREVAESVAPGPQAVRADAARRGRAARYICLVRLQVRVGRAANRRGRVGRVLPSLWRHDD